MKPSKNTKAGRILLALFIHICLFFSETLSASAEPDEAVDYLALAEERKSLEIQSNQIENWPAGPAIGAPAAILLEANTGIVLYAKNVDERLYPASTTKLMTCLVAVEHASMDEMVSFSHDAVFSIEPGSSNMGIDENEALPMEECLYGIMVGSANEVANAVAEHVAGSMDAFAGMMNEKARALGCTNTHFVNAHGLFDENHYTSASDLAIIARAFFQNELLSKIGNTASYHFEPTPTQPDDFVKRNKHKFITGEIAYDGIKGGKTGYTDQARQTLVTCAEKKGMKLICVVLKEESPEQFNDTLKLLDYGFANFAVTNVSENETKYNISSARFFQTSYDVFGNSQPILALNPNSYLILPKTVDFTDLTSEVSYGQTGKNQVVEIRYYYNNAYVGAATVDWANRQPSAYSAPAESTLTAQDAQSNPAADGPSPEKVIFINVKTLLIAVLAVTAGLILLTILRDLLTSYNFLTRRKRRKKSGSLFKRSKDDGPTF